MFQSHWAYLFVITVCLGKELTYHAVRTCSNHIDLKWKAVFDEAASLRQSYGSKGVRVLRNLDQPNEVVTVGDYEDLKRAGGGGGRGEEGEGREGGKT